MMIRVGFGYDVHRLETGHKFVLGGITIPHNKGCIAHSDGDVLIHAICDSLLGAAGMRDIGFHFPDTDDRYKNIDSKILLSKTLDMITSKGYSINNIDCTVCLEQPKIQKHIPEMEQVLSGTIKMEPGDISIKATTTEKMGFTGREEGVAAYAVALITRVR